MLEMLAGRLPVKVLVGAAGAAAAAVDVLAAEVAVLLRWCLLLDDD